MDAYLEQQTRGAFAKYNGNYDDPGATRMWFGKHVGERIDQLEPSYQRWLLDTRLKGPYRQMVRDFDDFKLIDDRYVEKREEIRKLSSSCGVKSTADKSRRNKNTQNDGWTAPPLCGYFDNAQNNLRNSSPITLRSCTTEAVGDKDQLSPSKASTASKGRGIKDRFRAFPPDTTGEKDANSRQDSIQPLSSSWDDTDVKLASHKRKIDSTMNLMDTTSQRARNRPVVASGTKRPKKRRQTTEPRQSSRSSLETRLPLAPLTSGTSNPSSIMKQGKIPTSQSKKSSSDTIAVHIPSSIESVAPKPKRRRRGTQSGKGVATYLWR